MRRRAPGAGHPAVLLTAVFVPALLLSLSLPGCELRPDLPREAEILWDEWAVPHVYAASEEELARGLGWAQMEAHGEAVLRLYAVARGEGALHYGEELFELDRYHHTVGLPEVARQWEEAQAPGFRTILEGFVRGINGWAEEHRDALSEEARGVLPVTVRDVLAHGLRAVHFTFVTSPGQLRRQSALWQRLPPGGEADGAAEAAAGRTLPPAPLAASNAWAVAPERTRDGNALLLVNPHLPWPDPRNPAMDLYRFFELHLTGPRGSFYGATLMGLPVPALGFNQHLGWTHTVNTYDGADFYRVPLADDGAEGEPAGYVLDGETMPFAEDTARVGVRGEDGEREERAFAVRRTVHGPVVTEEHRGEVLALRVAGLDRTRALEQWWELSWSRSLSDFEAVLRRMHLPMFNVLYADRDGNILKFYNGLVPRRLHGDWSWWQVPVDGSRSETLWDDFHGFYDLPRVLNPETGWLQNANEPPWLVTRPSPLDPDDFPAYVSPRDPGPSTFRAQASKRLLMEAGELTLEEMDRLRSDSRSEAAHRLLDGLVEAARAHGGETAREAADVLEDWDRRYRPESRGAALFYRWFEQYLGGGFQARRAGAGTLRELKEAPPASRFLYEELYEPDAEAFTTPRGLARPEAAVEALESAARELEGRGVALDAPWGDAARMRLGDTDLPAHGGSGIETFRVLSVAPDPDGGYRVAGGDTFILLAEFGDEPRGRALLTYGNASRPGFEYGHGGDQLEAYLEGRTREVLFRREAVEAAAVERVRLGEREVD